MADATGRRHVHRHSGLQRGRGHRRRRRDLLDAAAWREILVVDDGSTDDTGAQAAAAGARVIRHPYNKGNGAAVKTGIRHATGDVRADHRRRRAARAGRRDPARRAPGSSTISSSARDRARRRRRTAPASGQRAAERHRQLPDRTADSRSHVGLPRGPARLPARVPAPAAERILDAHDDDAGVHEGGLQRAVRAGRGAHGARASRRSASAPTACRSF